MEPLPPPPPPKNPFYPTSAPNYRPPGVAPYSSPPSTMSHSNPNFIEENASSPPFYTQGSYDGPHDDDKKSQSLFPASSPTFSPAFGIQSSPAVSSSSAEPLRPYIFTPPSIPSSPAFIVSHYAPTPEGYSSSLVSSNPDTPPPSFSRPRTSGLSYADFKPTFFGLEKCKIA